MKLLKSILVLLLATSLAGAAETVSTGCQIKDKKIIFTRESFAWRGQPVKALDWMQAFTPRMSKCLREAGLYAGSQECVLEGSVAVQDVAADTNAAARTSAPFMQISYQVKHSATGRLKAKGEIPLDAFVFSANDAKTFIDQTADAAACILTDNLVAGLLPPEITGRTEQGLLVVKARPQSALRAGEFLTVFARGEEIKDAAGKVVDWTEEAVGTVQIVRVAAEAVNAQVVEGDNQRIAAGCRLRRVQVR